MATAKKLIVKESFDTEKFVCRLAGIYRSRGYSVNTAGMNGSFILSFERGGGTFSAAFGMRERIKMTCMTTRGELSISFSGAEWFGRAVSAAAGLVLLFIPTVTAAVGAIRQSTLPRRIMKDALETVRECRG